MRVFLNNGSGGSKQLPIKNEWHSLVFELKDGTILSIAEASVDSIAITSLVGSLVIETHIGNQITVGVKK